MHLVATVILLLWVVAFVTTILNLATIPRLNPAARPTQEWMVSVIIPARNEARVIERTVRAMLAQSYSAFEVIVVDDRSTDETGAIVRAISDSRLRVVDGEETPPSWLGKPWALQQGTLHARGELLLFVDADVVYAPRTLPAAVAQLESSGAAMMTLFPHFEMHGFAENAAMPMLGFFAFTVLPLWWSNRSKHVGLALGGGSGNLIRREAFDVVGQFERLKGAVVDDVALGRLARQHGVATRAVLADDMICVRMYRGAREIVDGFCKNIFIALGRSFTVAVAMMVFGFALHLLPYGLAVTGDPISIATVIVITLIRVVLFRSLRYPLANAIFLHPVMIVFWATIFLRSVWMTGIRRQLVWRGRTYDATQTRFGAER